MGLPGMKPLALLLALHTVTFSWNQPKTPNLAYNSVYCSGRSGGPYTLLVRSKQPTHKISKTLNHTGNLFCVVTSSQRLTVGSNAVLVESLKSNQVEIVLH